MSFPAYKADEPCEHYFGNVCSGFGGSCVCLFCGWDRLEHPEVVERARQAFGEVLPGD